MAEAQDSFFDRYPWTGAAIFGAILAVVGVFLATTVGERPHYRAEWRLVNEAPEQGTFRKDAEFAADPVRIQVSLHVTREDGGPGIGLRSRLVETATATTLSEGVTGGPGGHLQLPVPARFDQVLFGRGLQVQVDRANGETVSATVPTPHRGRVTVEIVLSEFPLGAASGRVVDAAGQPIAGALVMMEWLDPAAGALTAQGPSQSADARGEFRFGPWVETGRARLAAYAGKNAGRSETPLTLPSHRQTIVVLAVSGLVGELVNAGKIEIERIGLLDPEGPGRAFIRSIPWGGPRFQIEGIPAGTYQLGVTVRNGTIRILREVALKSGVTQDVGQLELP